MYDFGREEDDSDYTPYVTICVSKEGYVANDVDTCRLIEDLKKSKVTQYQSTTPSPYYAPNNGMSKELTRTQYKKEELQRWIIKNTYKYMTSQSWRKHLRKQLLLLKQ